MRPRLVVITLAAAAACSIAQPRIRDAIVESKSAAAGLEQTVASIRSAQSTPVWIGWSVPLAGGDRTICWNDGGSGSKRAINLESPRTLSVFLRVENHQIAKVRPATPDCEIDGNGATVFWLSDVHADQSVAFLATLAGSSALSDSAISAIALHGDPSADSVLDNLASPSHAEPVRKKALFWMGVARGRHGYESLVRILQKDPSEKVRDHAVFALSQSKQAGAVEAIIAAARQDASAHVRGQALFWLAHAAQRQIAANAITRAIEQDPETEVKKKAVFALSQLPDHDGVPKLIDVARTNRNAEVRKQAMFWLGQSKDPRALQFFEQILTK